MGGLKIQLKKYIPSLRVIELEKENLSLRKELKKKDEYIAKLEQRIQDLEMLVAELQQMVFKKSNKQDKNDSDKNDKSNHDRQNPKEPRSKESYRRSIPGDDEVTKYEKHTLEKCSCCGGKNLEHIETKTIYTEDIPEIKKEVIKEDIFVYVCSDCQKEQSKISAPQGHDVRLGPRIKSYVLYQTYILNTSYREIIRSAWDYYKIRLSKGEIQYIQQKSALKLRPIYNNIHEELLNQESLNMDETGWLIKGVKRFVWNLCSPTNDGIILKIGSRGKGVANGLLKEFRGCLTSDCYGAYKNLEYAIHQICWVHVLRTAKDLCDSKYLTVEQKQSAKDFYDKLLIIYRDLKTELSKKFSIKRREVAHKRLIEELSTINQLNLCDTPKKLKNIKLLTQDYQEELFNCLLFKTALPENNLAERNLRHVVLKRKKSFGCQTGKGARIFEINCSVLLTLWRRFPDSFLLELAKSLQY